MINAKLYLALLSILLACSCSHSQAPTPTNPSQEFVLMNGYSYVQDGIVRGDRTQKKIALIFTGGDFGEGTPVILDALSERNIKGSFFVTGDYIRKTEHQTWLKRIVNEGHYLGPHSDSHPLYAPWDDRSRTLVTRDFFKADLEKNIADLKTFGALADAETPIYFIPPYEWYNQDQVEWAQEMGIVLFNFSPGSGSHRDWAPEDHQAFRPSIEIKKDILEFESEEDDGLNGFLLLLHLGSERVDKMHRLTGEILDELTHRGYEFVTVFEMIPLKNQGR